MTTGPKLYRPNDSDSIISEDIWNFLKLPENVEFLRVIEMGYRAFTPSQYSSFIGVWNSNFEQNKSVEFLDTDLKQAYGDLSLSIKNLDRFLDTYYPGIVDNDDRPYYMTIKNCVTMYPKVGNGFSWKTLFKNQNIIIKKYRDALEIFSDITIRKIKTNAPQKPFNVDSSIVYKIDFPKTRQIIINDKYFLKKPDFNSENANFFEYVFSRPDEKLTRLEIETYIKAPIKKSFTNIVSDLGFTGEIRKAFFSGVGKNSIIFHKSVTEDLNGAIKELFEKQLSNIENEMKGS